MIKKEQSTNKKIERLESAVEILLSQIIITEDALDEMGKVIDILTDVIDEMKEGENE